MAPNFSRNFFSQLNMEEDPLDAYMRSLAEQIQSEPAKSEPAKKTEAVSPQANPNSSGKNEGQDTDDDEELVPKRTTEANFETIDDLLAYANCLFRSFRCV